MDTNNETTQNTTARTLFSEELELALCRAADSVPIFFSEVSFHVGDLARVWGSDCGPLTMGVGARAKEALHAARDCFESWKRAGVAVTKAAAAVEAAANRIGAKVEKEE